MSKPANTSLIGAFILGGIVLLVIAIGIFGSGSFNSEKHTFVAYFEDSVNGLDIGSPVKFRGVTIGKVSQVLIRTEDQKDNDNAVPVIIEIDKKLLQNRGVAEYLASPDQRGRQVEKGMRARLQQLSIITGMLYVELDYFSDTPLKYHQKHPFAGIHEIPTAASNLGTLMKGVTQTLEQISQIKFSAIADKAEHLLTHLDDGISKLDFDRINKDLTGAADAANALLKNEELQKVPGNLNGAVAEFKVLAEKLSAKVDPLSDDIRKTSEQSIVTLHKLEQVAENLRLVTQPGSGIRVELTEMINQVSDAAQSFRTLTDYLKRHPNAVISGKPDTDDKAPAKKETSKR